MKQTLAIPGYQGVYSCWGFGLTVDPAQFNCPVVTEFLQRFIRWATICEKNPEEHCEIAAQIIRAVADANRCKVGETLVCLGCLIVRLVAIIQLLPHSSYLVAQALLSGLVGRHFCLPHRSVGF